MKSNQENYISPEDLFIFYSATVSAKHLLLRTIVAHESKSLSTLFLDVWSLASDVENKVKV